jgi:photosystem II stability/assembly factor-like uncharacterized protein
MRRRLGAQPRSALRVGLTFALAVALVAAFESPIGGASAGSSGLDQRPGQAPQVGPNVDPDDPFSKSRPANYHELRSEHVGLLRGAADLAANRLARAIAVQTMNLQERQRDQRLASPTGAAATPRLLANPAWTALGPAPIPNGQTQGVVQPVSGRVTSIAVHPTDPTIAYVGTAGGGLYRTLDAGATWTALMDNALSLAIGFVTLDPTDPTTVVVGTGEGNFSADSIFGVGVYVIRNANTTPTLVGPLNKDGLGSDVFTGRSISKIVVDPLNHNNVFVATTSGFGGISGSPAATLPVRGLYRSMNFFGASPTFTMLTVPTGVSNRSVTDIAVDPTDSNMLIAAVDGLGAAGDGGIWRSINALAATPSFTQSFTAQAVTKLAVTKVGSVLTVLAALDELAPLPCPANTYGTLRRSTDGGATFSAVLPAASGHCSGQCWYDDPVVMSPTDPNVIWLGGSADRTGTCASSLLIHSTDGTTFTRSATGLHADMHALAFAPSNTSVLWNGNDGGVWRSTDGGATWTSRNTASFDATQFQSIAVHPSDRTFSIGGTQDNGTTFLQPAGTWTRADFGDGGFALIDQNAADTTTVTMYHTYFNRAGSLMGTARVTSVSSAHDNGWSFLGCGGTPNGINCSDSAVLFYAPMALGPGSPNTLYYGSDRLYRSADLGTTMTVVSQQFALSKPVTAIGISAQNDLVRIVGVNGHIYATTTGANPLVDVTPAGFPTTKFVSRAVIDPTNANTAYVTISGYGLSPGQHIWKTTNLSGAPPTWVASGTGLPDVPVDSFVVDPIHPEQLYSGTDIGVYASGDAGATWTPYGSGLPRVPVFDLATQSANRLLRIATHGRGMWQAAISAAAPTVSAISPSSGPASGGTAVTISGTGFATSATVTIGGTAATGVTVVSATQITATTPAHAAGASNVVVTNPDAQTGTCAGCFTYIDTIPSLTFSPPGLNYGNVPVGDTKELTLTLRNNTSGAVTISLVNIDGLDASEFSLGLTDTCSAATLMPGGTCDVSAVFSPTTAGPKTASLNVSSDAAGSPHSATLSGNGTTPAVTMSPSSLNFGDQAILTSSAEQTITVQNTGAAPLNIVGVAIGGVDSLDFVIGMETCSGAILISGATCTVPISFGPTALGPKSASLDVTSNAPGSPHSATLSGNGIVPPPLKLGAALTPVRK